MACEQWGSSPVSKIKDIHLFCFTVMLNNIVKLFQVMAVKKGDIY